MTRRLGGHRDQLPESTNRCRGISVQTSPRCRGSVRLWAFETLSDPTEAGSNSTDGCHTGSKKPMLFNIFAGTKDAVAGEEVNLRTIEQTDDDQQEEAYSLKPLFHHLVSHYQPTKANPLETASSTR